MTYFRTYGVRSSNSLLLRVEGKLDMEACLPELGDSPRNGLHVSQISKACSYELPDDEGAEFLAANAVGYVMGALGALDLEPQHLAGMLQVNTKRLTEMFAEQITDEPAYNQAAWLRITGPRHAHADSCAHRVPA